MSDSSGSCSWERGIAAVLVHGLRPRAPKPSGTDESRTSPMATPCPGPSPLCPDRWGTHAHVDESQPSPILPTTR